MRFSSIAICLIPLALATPIARTDKSSAVISDLNQLNSDLKSLDSTLSSFADNAAFIPFTTLEQLNNQIDAVKADYSTTTSAAQGSSAFSTTESAKVLTAFKAVAGSLTATMNNLDAHKVAVQNAGATSQVESGMQQMASSLKAFISAISAKQAAPSKAGTTAAGNQMTASLNKAIATFA